MLPGQMLPGQMLPGQMSQSKLESVLDVPSLVRIVSVTAEILLFKSSWWLLVLVVGDGV